MENMLRVLATLILFSLLVIHLCGTGFAQSQMPRHALQPSAKEAHNPQSTSAADCTSNNPATTSVWPQAGLGLLLNVLGGVLTVLAVEAWNLYQKRWEARTFKRVYGDAANSCSLVYGSLSLHDRTRRAINSSVMLTVDERAALLSHPLGKASNPALSFSAERIASASEIRCASYIAESLSRYRKISAAVVSDDSIAERIDINFVAFGVLNNRKTLDAFSNPANTLGIYDSSGMFVTKAGNLLHPKPTDGRDYGVILKIHPEQFKSRTWVVCAGIGEWGTSGTAWFLSHKWRSLSERLGYSDQPFLAVIEVMHGQDESARMIAFGTPENPIVGYRPLFGQMPGPASNSSATEIKSC
jgi:hypothetical protein